MLVSHQAQAAYCGHLHRRSMSGKQLQNMFKLFYYQMKIVCCLPVARVENVSERLLNILKGKNGQSEVIVYIVMHDMGKKKRDEILQNEFRELGKWFNSETTGGHQSLSYFQLHMLVRVG